MDISEILLRHLDPHGAVYSPVAFVGAWAAEDQAAIRALITAHDGAPVPATYNTWHCTHAQPDRYSARRATWDIPLRAPTVAELLTRLRDYYGEG